MHDALIKLARGRVPVPGAEGLYAKTLAWGELEEVMGIEDQRMARDRLVELAIVDEGGDRVIPDGGLAVLEGHIVARFVAPATSQNDLGDGAIEDAEGN